MAASPAFRRHKAFAAAIRAACGETFPDGSGGHLYVDGTLHRIRDLSGSVRGNTAYAFSVNEAEFAQLCGAIDVENFAIKGLRSSTLAPLMAMSRLRNLHLWYVQRLDDLAPLAQIPLEVLLLEDIKHVHDLSPVANIVGLKALTVQGGFNTLQRVQSLRPLCALPDLEELALRSIRLDDDTLRPLADCAALRDLHLPNTFPTEDYAYLRALRNDLRCVALVPYLEMNPPVRFKHEVMVTGRRKPRLDAKQDRDRLTRYVREFDAMVAEFRKDHEN